jgi:hypothetical protein
MNIVGVAQQEMVNFIPPEEFFFGTNFDIETGNEQGGIYNRNFASIRVELVVCAYERERVCVCVWMKSS